MDEGRFKETRITPTGLKESKDGSGQSAQSAPRELEPNEVIAERYRVKEILGRGGMGTVYRVQQIFLGKDVALKTLSSTLSPAMWRRFQKEAKAAARLDHANLVKVQDFGMIADAQPFFVMDLVEGESLSALIRRLGRLPLNTVLEIFRQICLGVGYAHSQSVIHRDIKPGNIIVSNYSKAEMSVKVVDFGIAKIVDSEDPDSIALTRTGEIFGTPYYMSPEQCLGTAADHRADIYSAGCVLFEALTGLPPFMGDTALSTMMKQQTEKPPTLKEATLGQSFPADLEKVVAKLLQKDARARYESLVDVADDMQRLLDGKPVALGIKQGGTVKQKKIRPIPVVVGSVLAVLLIGAGYGIGKLTIAPVARTTVDSLPMKELEVVGETLMPKDAPERAVLPVEDAGPGDDSSKTGATFPFSATVPGTTTRIFHFGPLPLGDLTPRSQAFIYEKGNLVAAKGPSALNEILIEDFQPVDFKASPTMAREAEFDRFRPDEIYGLDLRNCFMMTDSEFSHVAALTGLKSIDVGISDSHLTGAAMDTLNKLPNLQELKIGHDAIAAKELIKLRRLRQLQRVDLYLMHDTRRLLQALCGSTVIRHLSLNHSGGDDFIDFVVTMPNLESLDLTKNVMTPRSLAPLVKLHHLQELNITDCPVDITLVPTLKQLPLKTLTVSNCTTAMLDVLKKALPSCNVVTASADLDSASSAVERLKKAYSQQEF
ncbi:MAG TPA: protein kinase [Planktothrix sp.]